MGLLDSLLGSVLGGGDSGKNQMVMQLVSSLINNHGSGQGLAGLVQQFAQKGLGDVAASWVSTGQNQPVSADQIQHVLGSDTIQHFAQQSGLQGSAVSSLLAQLLPQVIDQLTPHGQVPQQNDVQSALTGLLSSLGGQR